MPFIFNSIIQMAGGGNDAGHPVPLPVVAVLLSMVGTSSRYLLMGSFVRALGISFHSLIYPWVRKLSLLFYLKFPFVMSSCHNQYVVYIIIIHLPLSLIAPFYSVFTLFRFFFLPPFDSWPRSVYLTFNFFLIRQSFQPS